MRWAGHVACIGEKRNAFRAFISVVKYVLADYCCARLLTHETTDHIQMKTILKMNLFLTVAFHPPQK
jgi:hypothetical protein